MSDFNTVIDLELTILESMFLIIPLKAFFYPKLKITIIQKHL